MSKLSKFSLGLAVASLLATVSLYVFDPSKAFAQSGTTGTVTHSSADSSGAVQWTGFSSAGTSCWFQTDTRGNQVTTCGSDFGRETRKPITPTPTLAMVKAKAREVNVFEADIASEQYLKLAKNIGLKSAAIDESQLKMAIHGHGFKIYDFKSVDDYLYTMALKQGANYRWVWKPMREKDMEMLRKASRSSSENGSISNSLYGHAIPERILEDVACLLDEVPQLVALISDYEVKRPDPFLAVTTPEMWEQGKVLVIDLWAEPGFKENTAIQGSPAPMPERTIASR